MFPQLPEGPSENTLLLHAYPLLEIQMVTRGLHDRPPFHLPSTKRAGEVPKLSRRFLVLIQAVGVPEAGAAHVRTASLVV